MPSYILESSSVDYQGFNESQTRENDMELIIKGIIFLTLTVILVILIILEEKRDEDFIVYITPLFLVLAVLFVAWGLEGLIQFFYNLWR